MYAARHVETGHGAAIKVLRREMVRSASMVARFQREIAAINTIRHPNITEIYEFGELTDGCPFYAMELLEGTNLKALIQLSGRFSPLEAYGLLTPICSALEAVHAAGIIHRDLKASNISIVDGPNGRSIKLLDFGIAKLMHPEPGQVGLTEAGTMIGTSHNMAPEQIRCDVLDARTDVYALGVMTYQLLTGRYPFRSENLHEIARLHLEAPAPRPSLAAPVSPAVDAVVLKCLEKDPERRYKSVALFIAALGEAVGGGGFGVSDEIARGIGIYVECRFDDAAADDPDDAMLEDMTQLLDSAEIELRSRGFHPALHTGNAILGIRLESDDCDPLVLEETGIEIAQQIAQLFSQRDGRDERVHFRIAAHADNLEVRRNDGETFEAVGGALLDLESWTVSKGISVERA